MQVEFSAQAELVFLINTQNKILFKLADSKMIWFLVCEHFEGCLATFRSTIFEQNFILVIEK